MTIKTTVDAARVELLLGELRLPGVKLMWAKLAEVMLKATQHRAALVTTKYFIKRFPYKNIGG